MFTYHVIHLSNAEIVCLPWRFGRPVAEHRFANDEAGLAAFSTYLRDWQNIPTRIVVDLIEEDLRVETLPHLRGRDRRVVLERRLSQLYRATPFRLAVLQGRETTGRRDDIALCTAITQNESFVARAKPEIVEAERQKEREWTEKIARLTEKAAALGG